MATPDQEPTPAPPPAPSPLDNLGLILVRPKSPENVGAAIRVAMNMGIAGVALVGGAGLDEARMRAMATSRGEALLATLARHPSLAEAVAPYHLVAGTTARIGRHRQVHRTPHQLAAEVAPLLAGNRVAILFGPEDRGLSNEDLAFCQVLVSIPTADFSSLNLAQAVAIIAYELRLASLSSAERLRPQPRRANQHELAGMYRHLEEALRTVGFLKHLDAEHWMGNVRRFLGRVGLSAKEVRLVRGVCRQLLWWDGQRQQGAPPPAPQD
ncbi:MAG: RNA methyltransferase [Thermodesulfobacteriota bacterium]